MSIMFSSAAHPAETQPPAERIRSAPAPDTRLFADVIANACPRALALVETRKRPA